MENVPENMMQARQTLQANRWHTRNSAFKKSATKTNKIKKALEMGKIKHTEF